MGSSAPAIRCLPNGLLDLEVTPEHLVPIVQRNATQSPLLRLPAEIRKKICEFALSDIEFFYDEMPCTCPEDFQCMDDTCDVCRALSDKDRFRVFVSVNDSPVPAFHLNLVPRYHLKPEPCPSGIQFLKTSPFDLSSTCRQLYSETTTLPYKLSTFVFPEWECLFAFHRHLLPAQRDAVGTLCTDNLSMSEMVRKHNYCPLVEIFPSLRRVWLFQDDRDCIPEYLEGLFDDLEVKWFTLKTVPSELGTHWKAVLC